MAIFPLEITLNNLFKFEKDRLVSGSSIIIISDCSSFSFNANFIFTEFCSPFPINLKGILSKYSDNIESQEFFADISIEIWKFLSEIESEVSPGTFSNYIKVIETLNQSDDKDTKLLLQYIYSIAERYPDDD